MVINGAGEGNMKFENSNGKLDQTGFCAKLHHLLARDFQKSKKFEEHQIITKMDMRISVGLVSSHTIQISLQFILKVPISCESTHLGFDYKISIPDFTGYGPSFAKLTISQ